MPAFCESANKTPSPPCLSPALLIDWLLNAAEPHQACYLEMISGAVSVEARFPGDFVPKQQRGGEKTVPKESQLRFYFDFLCPYSYLAWHVMDQFARTQEIPPLEFFAIGNHPPDNPNLHNRHRWSPERWQRIREHGKRFGLVINPPAEPPELTLLPQRALCNYTGTGLREYVTGIFRSHFTHGVNLSSATQISDFLQMEGIDPIPFQLAVKDPETLKLVQEHQHLWGTRRIRMIPTLEIEDERLSGIIDRRGIENFLSLFLS